MRIAYYIWDTYTAGGLQRITIDKVNYFAEHGDDVLLITSCQKGRSPFWPLHPSVMQVDLDIDYHASVNSISNPVKRFFAKASLRTKHRERLEKALSMFRADICVNTIFSEEGEIFPMLEDGSAKVLESHGVKYALFPQIERRGPLAFLGNWVESFKRKAYEEMPRKYNHFVVLSSAHIEQWEGYINISAIPNMCVLSTEGKRSTLESKVVSILARFAPEKNIPDLVGIWAKVVKLCPGWELHIWGDGPLRSQIESRVAELDLSSSIVLKGETSDVMSAYLGSSIICLCSKYEGLPMTLIEAQSCGLPIVSYDCPLGPRSIIHEGVDGFLITPGDEEEFAQKLLLLIQDKKLRIWMGENAYQHSQAYLPNVVMMQWNSLFESILQDRM